MDPSSLSIPPVKCSSLSLWTQGKWGKEVRVVETVFVVACWRSSWISIWLQVLTYRPVFTPFAEKNQVFLNRMSPLWKYFLTYLQGQFISPMFCGMFQADTAHSPRGLLQLQYFQVFIYCEIWLARLDEFLWDTATAIFNVEKLFCSLLNPFANMAYHFTRA